MNKKKTSFLTKLKPILFLFFFQKKKLLWLFKYLFLKKKKKKIIQIKQKKNMFSPNQYHFFNKSCILYESDFCDKNNLFYKINENQIIF